MFLCVCVCVCARARARERAREHLRACVHLCVRACVRACTRVFYLFTFNNFTKSIIDRVGTGLLERHGVIDYSLPDLVNKL